MRAKAENWNDETRVKQTIIISLLYYHYIIIFQVKQTIISADPLDWSAYCGKLVAEIQSLGGDIPSSIDTSLYVK